MTSGILGSQSKCPMDQDDLIWDVLKFELSFLEDGGYGAFPARAVAGSGVFEIRRSARTSAIRRGRIPATAACWSVVPQERRAEHPLPPYPAQ